MAYEISPNLDFERVVLVHNPYSTAFTANAKQANARLDAIRDTFPGQITEIATEEDRNKTVAQLDVALRPHDLVWVCTGDSGPGVVAEVLASKTRQNTASINEYTMLPDNFGNASDFAHAMFETPGKTPPEDCVNNDRVRRLGVYPLVGLVKEHGKPYVNHFAVTQIGLGLSGKCTEVLNSPEFRDKKAYQWTPTRNLLKYLAVAKGYARSELFTIQSYDAIPNAGYSPKEHTLLERIAYNADVAADKGRPPIKAHEDAFFMTDLPHRGVLSVLRQALQLKNGTLEGDYIKQGDSALFKIVSDNVTLQYDGEARRLAANTFVTLKLYEAPFAVVTDKKT